MTQENEAATASLDYVTGSGAPLEAQDFSAEISKNNDNTIQIGDLYDPRPQEDGARRTIAYLLIGLLYAVVLALFGLIAFGLITVADIKDFAVILGPVVTLVSAATGFYYGTKSTIPSNNS